MSNESSMNIIEMEIWKDNPDRPGTLIFDRQRIAQDVFNELEAHLKADGRLPDEYFLFSHNWRDGKLFPKNADILCNVNFGGSEGIYLDVSVRYEKEVPKFNAATNKVETVKQRAIEQFAAGKTLGDSLEDLDRMNLVASSVTAAFYGMRQHVKARYVKIERGEEQAIYPIPHTDMPSKSLSDILHDAKTQKKEKPKRAAHPTKSKRRKRDERE
jgi:hypothetical protein